MLLGCAALAHAQQNRVLQATKKGSDSIAELLLLYAPSAVERPWLQRVEGEDVYDPTRNAISVAIQAGANSQSISSRIMGNYLSSKYTTEKDKQAVDGRLSAGNRLGYNFTDRYTYTTPWIAGNRQVQLAYEGTVMAGLAFPKDAFQLVFRGNGAALGQTLHLSNAHLRQWTYHSVEAAFVSGKQRGSLWPFTVRSYGVSVYEMNAYQDFRLQDASLYTSPGGDSLNLKGRYTRDASNPNQRGLYAPNGVGLGLSFVLDARLAHGLLTLTAKDLGVAYFSNKSVHENFPQQEIPFTGIVLPNLNALRDSGYLATLPDSLRAKYAPASTHKSFARALPASFVLSYGRNIGSTFVGLGIRQWVTVGFIPEATLLATHRIPKSHFTGRVAATFGGFGGFNLGLGLGYQIRRVNFVLQTRSVLGFVAPATASGLQAMVGFSYRP